VLKYTGREKSVTLTRETFDEWTRSSSHDVNSWSGSGYYGVIGGSASSNQQDDKSNATYQQWKKDYFQALDTVFGPAIEAWKACMSNDAITIKPTTVDSDELVVDLVGRQGEQLHLDRISAASGVTCRVGGKALPSDGVDIKGTVLSVACDRTDNSTEAKRVTFYATNGSFKLMIPERVLPPLQWSEDNSVSLLALTGCNQLSTIPASNRDRQLHVNVTMRGEGKHRTGSYRVMINGTEVASNAGGDPGDNNQWGTPPAVGAVTIPAGIPVLVHATGSVSGGSCVSLAGGVFTGAR